MPIYEFAKTSVNRLRETSFSRAGLHERRDLQRLLRDNIDVIAPETLIVAEEFGDWEDSRRRIDLLAIDKDANLVVIELKRTEDGGHMDLQSIRYASMVSKMTFEQVADCYGRYLKQLSRDDVDAKTAILDFLEWDEANDAAFAQDVRIVLASAEFSKEITSSVLWLNDHGTDINCVRMRPYDFDGRILVDVQQIIPLPEANEYQVRAREKILQERQSRASQADCTRFDVRILERLETAMWKRNAIFFICKQLCNNGIDPEGIAALFDWRPSRVWYSVDGTLNSVDFIKAATETSKSLGSEFRVRRWFCDDDEIVHANGRTYAFSNQWGGERWHDAMNALKHKYESFAISFSPTSPDAPPEHETAT